MTLPFAEIHFPIPVTQGYTYRVPEELDQQAKIGSRALVPFGKRVMTGVITQRVGHVDFDMEKLKDIHDILDDESVFDEDRLALAKWIAEYYLASLGETLRTMLPSGLERKSKRFVKLIRTLNSEEVMQLKKKSPCQAEIVTKLVGKKGYKVSYLLRQVKYKNVQSSIQSLAKKGLVQVSNEMYQSYSGPRLKVFLELTAIGKKLLLQKRKDIKNCSKSTIEGRISTIEKIAHVNDEFFANSIKLTEKQWTGLDFLHDAGRISRPALLQSSGLSDSVFKALAHKSLVQVVSQQIDRKPYGNGFTKAPEMILNEEQAKAVEQISSSLKDEKFSVFLLHGITGSGKTQVYIEAIRQTLALKKSAIVLVPEISLTPQAVARFQGNFGESVAVLHSRLSAGERYDAWRNVQHGKAKVVVGARSAVFAPTVNLGLIVVDEEHDSSYKQVNPAPRYHARDVAIMRAKMLNAVVLIGSATPAVESYYNALTKKYHLVELPNRIDNVPLPKVRLIDMKRFRRSAPDGNGIFSRILYNKIIEKLEKKEQIILLQNRRGFAPVLRCCDCGFTSSCDACEIPLTYHKRGHVTRCHYCNFTERAPDQCSQCKGTDLIFKGIGTQKVEGALHDLIPEARVIRMDFDTTQGKFAHDQILRQFEQHHFDILLGTQMIAKGLDFDRVTLVGVISADINLLRPDFRAGERTFQLLTQVAGRAGRGDLPGEVIIQTYSPENSSLLYAKKHDFHGFYNSEIEQRRMLQYPPYARLAVVMFRHKDNERVAGVANDFTALLKSQKIPMTIYGPTPSALQRVDNEFRWQLMVKNDPVQDPGAQKMRQALSTLFHFFHKAQSKKRAHVYVDVDAVTMV